MDSPDFRLAAHAARLRFADLPPAAVEKAKVFLLDTIAVGVAGSSVPEVAPVLAAMDGRGGEAAVWGTPHRLPAPAAALVNGFQVHCQEWDSLHGGAVLHAMATLAPVLLAEAERRGGIGGAALLTALCAGVDVACTLGLAARGGWRFFRPATAGGFGAVAGLANLRGLDAGQTLSAFGHQLGQVSGTMQAHAEGSPVLPLQIGVNARAAFLSCDLAAAGLPSLALPLTGARGFLPMFEGDYDLAPLLASLGRRFLIAELSHKPFPCGRATHGGVEGLLALRAAHGFGPADVAAITVSAPPLINTLVARPALPAPPANYARICMPFVLAKLLQHGAVRAEDFRGAALADPETFALGQRVSVRPNGVTDPNALLPQEVTVTLRDGRVLAHPVASLLASPERPLDAAAQAAKRAACWALSAAPLGAPAALAALVAGLETLADVTALVRAATPG